MASVRVDQLGAATTVSTADLLPLEQAGVLKKATVAQLLASTLPLKPVALKSGAYTAGVNEFVPCDTTAAAFTVTLPTAPADGTRVAVKVVVGPVAAGTMTLTHALTVACGGADVLNKAGGPTSGSATLLNQGINFVYSATLVGWYVVAEDLPLSSLDLRYALVAGANFTGAVTGPTPTPGDDSTKLATTAFVATDYLAKAGGTLTGPLVTTAVKDPLIVLTDAATVDIDLDLGNKFYLLMTSTVGATRDLTVSNAAVGQGFTLVLKQPASGGPCDIGAYPLTTTWGGGPAPALTVTASKTDVRSFLCVGTGEYLGFKADGNF